MSYKFDFMNGNVEILPEIRKVTQQIKRVFIPITQPIPVNITLSFILNRIETKKIHWQKTEVNGQKNLYNRVDCKITNCEHCLSSDARTEYVTLVLDKNIEPKILTYYGQIMYDEIEILTLFHQIRILTWYDIYKTGLRHIIKENKNIQSAKSISIHEQIVFTKMFDDFCEENSYSRSEI